MYTWILSTGWWKTRAPVNPDAVFVISLLCASLIGGFIYIYRVKPLKLARKEYHRSWRLIVIVTIVYCLWCVSQIYLVSPRQPAVGEEADLGVLVFLCIFFFLPHCLCILSMNSRDVIEYQRVCKEEELKGAVALIFANKQDFPGALDDAAITEALELYKIRNRQ